MGQFGPLPHGGKIPPDALLYGLGVGVSAILWSLAFGSIGAVVAARWEPTERLALIGGVAGWIFCVDLIRKVFGSRRYSIGLARQTPYAWRLRGPIGVFGWGVDTGTPFTTIRATSMPIPGTAFIVLGFAPIWVGLLYGLGILLGLFSGLLLRRLAKDATGYELAHRVLVERGGFLTRGWGVVAPSGVTMFLAILVSVWAR